MKLVHIYMIENQLNGKCYIGSTTNYKSRWYAHKSTLRNGIHHSFILQKAWDKWGEEAFKFKLLLQCAVKDMLFYETLCMKLQSYNLQRTPRQVLFRGGWKHSEEFKQKISLVHKGVPFTEEHKAKLSAARKGYVHDAAFKEKARLRQTGRKYSQATGKKISDLLVERHRESMAATVKTVKNIYQSYDGAKSIRSLCAAQGISAGTFYGHCKMLGLPPVKHVHMQSRL